MADDLNVTNPSPNQILVYDSVEQAFVNVNPSLSLFGNTTFVTGGMSLGAGDGEHVFNNTVSNTMRFRRIRGQNGIDVGGSGSYIDISFDGDAQTLGGLSKNEFLEKSKNLSDVDSATARGNLNVYSASDTDSKYLFANQTNVPDADATYDLGANGLRYADIYAVTFHGRATEAIIAQTLEQNGARDKQVLTWIDGEGWVPRDSASSLLSGLGDVVLDNLTHESILLYNGIRDKWEAAPLSTIGSHGGGDGDGDGGSAGTIIDAENVGNGIGTYYARFGGNIQFRSISEGDNITVETNFNNEEIKISADVPQDTDELPEGNNNKYFTTQRVRDAMSTISIQDLGKMENGSPTDGQAPVWDGTQWEYVDVATNLNTTDDLMEGTTNLYYTQDRAFTDISEFLIDSNNGIYLNDLRDVDATTSNGTFLYSDGSKWINHSIVMDDISNVSLTGLSDGSALVYNASTEQFEVGVFPKNLIDLEETSDSLHFTQSSFDNFFGGKTTNDLSETSQNRFLNKTNLINQLQLVSIDELSDVDIGGISDSNVLVWDSSQSSFVPADSSSLNVTVNMGVKDLNDVDEGSVLGAQDGQVLMYNDTNSQFEVSDISQTISDLTDVNSGLIEDGQVLAYRSGMYEPSKLLPYDDTNTPSDGSILQYNTSLSAFEVVDGGNVGVENMSDLLDVTITSISGNDLITYDDALSVYVNKSVSDVVDIFQIGNVNTSGITEGQGLVYDGSQFINKDILPYDLDGVTNNQILQYDGLTSQFKNVDLFGAIGINIGTGAINEVLKYDVSSETFTNQTLEFNDISNISDSGSDDQSINALLWNQGTGEYEVVNLEDTLSLETLSDVDVIEKSKGSVVRYNDTNGRYEIDKPNVLESGDINSLDIADGDSLVWNAQDNEFVTGKQSLTLGELSDVTENIPNIGDAVVWNGGEYALYATSLSYTEIVKSSNPIDFWNFNDDMLGYIDKTELTPSSSYDYYKGVGVFGSDALSSGTSYDTSTLPTPKSIAGELITLENTEAGTLSLDFWYQPSTNINYGDGSVTYEIASLTLSTENVVGASIKVALMALEDDSTSIHEIVFFKNGTRRKGFTVDIPQGKLNHVAIDYTKSGASTDIGVYVDTVRVIDDTVTAAIDNDSQYNLSINLLTELGTGSEPYIIDKLCVYDNVQTLETIQRKFTNVTGNGNTSSGSGSTGSIGDNSDVTISGLSIGDTLIYNGSEFINQQPSSVSVSLNDVTDVGLSVPSSGEVLKYTGSQWVNEKLDYSELDGTPVHITSLSGLSDVDENMVPVDGNILQYNESEGVFEAVTFSGVDSLVDLIDVDETVTPTDNQVLTYNASKSKYEPRDAAAPTQGSSVKEFSASDNQATFSVSHEGEALVFANGFLLPSSEVDLLSDENSITLNTPRALNDNIRVMVIYDQSTGTPTNLEASTVNALADEVTMTSGQTAITFEHSGMVMVYANGILLPTSEVDTSDTTQITLNTARNNGDIIRIVDFV